MTIYKKNSIHYFILIIYATFPLIQRFFIVTFKVLCKIFSRNSVTGIFENLNLRTKILVSIIDDRLVKLLTSHVIIQATRVQISVSEF